MSEVRDKNLSRRGVMQSLVAATAGAAVSRVALGSDTFEMPGRSIRIEPVADVIPGHVLAATRGLLARSATPIPTTTIVRVLVAHVRSWDRSVYLYAGQSLRGFVTLDATAFGLAVAAQAAGGRIYAAVWGHEPGWGNGVGRFEGAALAIDPHDFPGLPADSLSSHS